MKKRRNKEEYPRKRKSTENGVENRRRSMKKRKRYET